MTQENEPAEAENGSVGEVEFKGARCDREQDLSNLHGYVECRDTALYPRNLGGACNIPSSNDVQPESDLAEAHENKMFQMSSSSSSSSVEDDVSSKYSQSEVPTRPNSIHSTGSEPLAFAQDVDKNCSNTGSIKSDTYIATNPDSANLNSSPNSYDKLILAVPSDPDIAEQQMTNGVLPNYVHSHQRHSSGRKNHPSGNSLRHIEQFQMLLEKKEADIEANLENLSRKLFLTCDLRGYVILIILLFINILNYMDRYTIAGVLVDVQEFYGITKGQAGLLQTAFILSYMVLSPLFGYLGDRYNRKYIMAVGIFFWAIITLGSSFIPAHSFWLFVFMRALVGIGEASYSTLAPTIIADLFSKNMRTKALSIFYFAIPVGTGLGYIVGSKVAEAMGHWQWALRVTPGFGIVCVVLLLLVVKEPQRGAADGGTHLSNTSWGNDIMYLLKHKSFMLSTMGFTCVAFAAGAVALWAPTYVYYSIRVQPTIIDEATVSLIFGLITCVSGFLGVGMGSWMAAKLRVKNKRADPLVCAFGLISSAPFVAFALYISKENVVAAWVAIFIGETLLSLNWAIVTDILLYIVIPTRRSSAEAVQILISHAFGDAGSPYIVGAVADALTKKWGEPHFRGDDYLSLQYSLYMVPFMAIIGGGFFLGTALYIQEDREKTEKVIKGLGGVDKGFDGSDETSSPVSDYPGAPDMVSVPSQTPILSPMA